MTLPRRIQVGPRSFTVSRDPVEVGKQDAEGVCFPKYERIHLAADLSPGNERVTLLHEVMHACFDDATVDGPFTDGAIEEIACRTLAPRLLDTLRRNPRLVAYLTGNG